ncbi:hypothetical protein A5844_000711 [Enterococcus sp. 10A9_DIV0425]|uniref:Uncharacterized protein n=1 Tax=Candidatus Enterococcus wittei TaxID=1987383 RepID=A0A2C9XRL2_9ENTE|nr:hypothetical protein [Enterococcus sp. 10A9_DIV0425]OTP12478.1 hypothetical protein A5844_000711 [Enterococcus sp. 10A9_DIV0425]THE10447.1 hypothetical protein E1H99_09610 [Enterococcus hirae]
MKERIKIEQVYLFFWFFPIFLLPFTWVNAVVQGAEILGLINGSGLIISRNFPVLTIFYFLISVSLLFSKIFIHNFNWHLIQFSCMLIFTSIFSILPRIIIGPNGLSESGLKDTAYSSMYFLTIKPCFYIAIISFVCSVCLFFYSELRLKSVFFEKN